MNIKQKIIIIATLFLIIPMVMITTREISRLDKQTPPNSKAIKTSSSTDYALKLRKIGLRTALDKEARRLGSIGLFDRALTKLEEAFQPKYWTDEWELDMGKMMSVNILKFKRQYSNALNELKWFLDINPKKYEPDRRELLALIEYEKTGNKAPIYEHIDYLKKLYPQFMPPNGYSETIVVYISDIFRLYDTIGDYDAGIKYIDEILVFLKERRKAKGDSSYVLYDLKTSQEAINCMNKPRPNPDLNGCRFMMNYLLVREAFEREKANGGPTCGKWGSYTETPEGKKYCVGDATQALIQSDYFPW